MAEFESLLASARHAENSLDLASLLQKAVALYQDDLLTGYYQDWVLTERRRLKEEYLQALRQLTHLHERMGQQDMALAYARRRVAGDSLQEEAQSDLIRLLAANGQTAAALRQFQEVTDLLSRELGVAPSAELQATAERIRREGSPKPSPPSPLSRTAFPALPTPLTRLFGREAEIARICRMIQSEGARLITLTGTGGSGKTRLSIAVGSKLRDAFAGAVAFVPLADLDDAQMIPAALATALRLPDSTLGSPMEAICNTLSARPFLLILDNLEHLLSETIPLVRELLDCSATLTILATSRQRLGLEGERELPLPSLSLPESSETPTHLLESPSIQLFVDRAQAVRPDFQLTSVNAESVAQLCARLDGLPLAIELCAAWAQTLTPSQMLEKLDRRFDLLVSRRTDITPRHRTLRAALEYSYLLLSPEQQRLLTRLSIFRGGWSLEAAVAVCSNTAESDSLPLLAELTELRERSLVLAEDVGTTMRYRMLETLREFSGELLTYADRMERRRLHALYFQQLSEQVLGLLAPEQEGGLVQLDRELENLRTALAWSLETGNSEAGLRISSALGRYWSIRGLLNEGYQWLQRLLDKTDDSSAIPPDVLGRAWSTLGHLAWAQGNYATAHSAHERALTLRRSVGDTAGIAESLYHLGITAYREDNYDVARAFLNESLSLSQQQGDEAGIARVLLNLGNIAYELRQYAEARDLYQQSLDRERSLGNRQRIANAFNNLGLIAIALHDYPLAAQYFEESLVICRELTDRYSETSTLVNLAAVIRLQGQRKQAYDLLIEGMKLAYDLGNKHILVHYLIQLGLLEGTDGDLMQSTFLLSAALHLFQGLAGSQRITDAEEYSHALAEAQERLSPALFNQYWNRGQALPLSQIISQLLATPDSVGGPTQ